MDAAYAAELLAEATPRADSASRLRALDPLPDIRLFKTAA